MKNISKIIFLIAFAVSCNKAAEQTPSLNTNVIIEKKHDNHVVSRR